MNPGNNPAIELALDETLLVARYFYLGGAFGTNQKESNFLVRHIQNKCTGFSSGNGEMERNWAVKREFESSCKVKVNRYLRNLV